MSLEFLVYLAGPIQGETYRASTDWRQYVQRHMPPEIRTLSPMRYKEYMANLGTMPDHLDSDPLSTMKGIVTRDRMDVMRCDMVIANLAEAQRVSIGTVMEIAWADACRKPVVAIMDQNNIHYHGMIRECVGYIVPTLDQAIDIVRAVLLPDFCREE